LTSLGFQKTEENLQKCGSNGILEVGAESTDFIPFFDSMNDLFDTRIK
jgi:hypothetical protein